MFNDTIEYQGNVTAELVDKQTGKIIQVENGSNRITIEWLERLSAYLGGFGGIDVDELRPFEIIAYSNAQAAESGTTSLTSSISAVTTSSGLTGAVYYENGNLDLSYLGKGKIMYKGDFSPGDDGATTETYVIRSLRLATNAGTTTVGVWTKDAYCPVAVIRVADAFPGFSNGEIIVSPNTILIIKWILNCIPGASNTTGSNPTSGIVSGSTLPTGGDGSQIIDYSNYGGVGNSKVLCTELHRQGLLEDNIYKADSEYAKNFDSFTTQGYHYWAIPVAEKMKTSKLLTYVLKPFITSWAHHMAYLMGVTNKDNMLGNILQKIGIPICRFIGKRIKQTQCI